MSDKRIVRMTVAALLAGTRASASGCLEWQRATDADGYGKVRHLMRDWQAHRLLWVLAYGPLADGMYVLHRCDNPPCINPDHLYPGTQQENVADMVRRGRFALGERHGMARLTAGDVQTIRRLCADGVKQAQLARQFGVTKTQIGAIVHRKQWKHLPSAPGATPDH